MKEKLNGILLLLLLLFLVGCSTEEFSSSSSKPDAEEVLAENSEADIFQLNGNIYQTGIDWVESEKVTKNNKIGEISKVSKDAKSFENGVATNLSEGVEIYTVKENKEILVAIVNGKEMKYLALSEG
ncbi:hypothetical protein CHH91_14090 [Virgibacillus sp. 7505]|uniref:hypothetical protein n=1 Tax=Virgibacillus sp. 7505 TaxID=2022548 RepID=UPI000BA5FDFE|nr:hypothetical protein [Virgibacillus sp. 7505]PAE15441.1 hypothetical protein CHH91_14090 [Virgibacillus sp. 7505]